MSNENNLYDVLQKTTGEYPNKIWMLYEGDSKSLTFTEVKDKIDQLSRALYKAGIRKGLTLSQHWSPLLHDDCSCRQRQQQHCSQTPP